MRTMRFITLLTNGASLVLFTCCALTAVAGVTAPGAKLVKLAGDFAFTEGPTCDAAGNVFFTDQPNDRIMKWSTEGRLTTFLQPSGRSNGLYCDAGGNLIACADARNELWSISPEGKVRVLVKDYEGRLLNGPNDVWVSPRGSLYLTDPCYLRPYWKRGPQEIPEQVYLLRQGERGLRCVTSDLVKPNGITGTPDGKQLYVSDIGAGKTYVYSIQADGSLAGKTLFCELGSDGMTIDNEGNLYLTGKGVSVFDKTGRRVEHIEVPEDWTANVCIGGKERRTLFITASKGLYAIALRTAGANPGK